MPHKYKNKMTEIKSNIEVFNQKVRIRPRISTGKFQGRYTKENQEWLEQNEGTIINAYRDGLNYYKLENGFICHIYECSDVSGNFKEHAERLGLSNVNDSLYPLIDRLQKHSEWKYPERKWNIEIYYDIAFAWMGKEKELEERVLKLENDMKLAGAL